MENAIKKYQFKSGLNLEFEILNLSNRLKTTKDLMTVPHRAQFFQVIWLEKGNGKHWVDFKPVELDDNMIIFIPSNSVNLFDKNGSYQGKSILFTDSFFCKNQDDVKFLHSSILYSDLYNIATIKIKPQNSGLRTLFNEMETEFCRKPDQAQYHILHNMLHIFLLQAEREMREQGFEELLPSPLLDNLIRFKDLLENKFRQEKSVQNYAASLNLTEKQLNKATTALLDKTPKQLIDERVVLEAKRLLAHSTLSVKEISYELGYDEPTNFVKYFKKHTKQTPIHFREQL